MSHVGCRLRIADYYYYIFHERPEFCVLHSSAGASQSIRVHAGGASHSIKSSPSALKVLKPQRQLLETIEENGGVYHRV